MPFWIVWSGAILKIRRKDCTRCVLFILFLHIDCVVVMRYAKHAMCCYFLNFSSLFIFAKVFTGCIGCFSPSGMYEYVYDVCMLEAAQPQE